MALRNILLDDEPMLLKKSRPVTDFNERLHILLDDMKETLQAAEGAGLAAPQVGILRRVVLVLDTGGNNGDASADSLPGRIMELINPEIIEKDGEQEGMEGCLSLPNKVGIVKRPQKVKVRAYNRYGKEFEKEVQGFTARAMCHEIDHLDGVLYTTLATKLYDLEEVDEEEFEREKKKFS